MPRAVDGATQQAINTLQSRVDADPDIKAILQREQARLQTTRDRGGSDRDYQNRVRDQITSIAKQKGYIPKEGQYFINPNDGQLEPHGGWAGLSAKTKGAIIAAAAATGVGAAAAAGAFGGAATAAGMPASGIAPSLSGYGVTSGMGAAIAPGVAGTGATVAGGGGILSTLGKAYGVLGKAGEVYGALSPVLGQAAGARASAQDQDEYMALNRDRINQDAAQSNFLNSMKAREYNQAAPGKRVASGARAALGAAGPVTFQRGAAGGGVRGRNSSFSGGHMAALADPRMKDISNRAMEQNIASQLNGEDQMAMPEMIPGATPGKKSGIIDKALGIGAFGTGVLGALNTVRRPRSRVDFGWERPDPRLTGIINDDLGRMA